MVFEIPWSAFAGGMLLGLAAVLLLMVNGRIAGISGIVAGLLKPQKDDVSWRLLFLMGMVVAGLTAPLFGVQLPEYSDELSGWSVIVAGLLVGIGTKLANGCTSGHGICGMGRLSTRSIYATCIFMAVAMFTVYIRFHR